MSSNPGTETFTDLANKSSGARNFSFGVCYQDGGSQHVIYNLDYVTADGVHHTASQEYGSDGAFTTFNGGAAIPHQPLQGALAARGSFGASPPGPAWATRVLARHSPALTCLYCGDEPSIRLPGASRPLEA